MYTDCCFESNRKLIKDGESDDEIPIAQKHKDDKEIELLFRDNTKRPPVSEKTGYSMGLPASGMGKSTMARLKIEFRFLRHIMRLNSADKYDDSLDLATKYYTQQFCKKKGVACGNEGWCCHCSRFELAVTDLKCLDDLLTDNFKFI